MAISAEAIARGANVAVSVILLAMVTLARWGAQPARAAETPPAAPASPTARTPFRAAPLQTLSTTIA